MPLTERNALTKDLTMPQGKAVMEHRHFAVVADILRRYHAPADPARKAHIIEHFADELASTNPRFDRNRFIRACNAEG